MISLEELYQIKKDIESLEEELKSSKKQRQYYYKKFPTLTEKSMVLFDLVYEDKGDKSYRPNLQKLLQGLEDILTQKRERNKVEEELGNQLFKEYCKDLEKELS